MTTGRAGLKDPALKEPSPAGSISSPEGAWLFQTGASAGPLSSDSGSGLNGFGVLCSKLRSIRSKNPLTVSPCSSVAVNGRIPVWVRRLAPEILQPQVLLVVALHLGKTLQVSENLKGLPSMEVAVSFLSHDGLDHDLSLAGGRKRNDGSLYRPSIHGQRNRVPRPTAFHGDAVGHAPEEARGPEARPVAGDHGGDLPGIALSRPGAADTGPRGLPGEFT
jgi:hypothetical protein